LLSRQLSRPPDGFAGLARSAFGGLLVSPAAAQFAKDAFALELPLEEFQRLIDVVVADEDLDDLFLFGFGVTDFVWPGRVARRVQRRATAALGELKVGRGGFAGAAVGRDLVAQLLAFPDFGNTGRLDGGDVNEHVRAAFAWLDEAEPATVIEELYGTCGHVGLL